MLDGFPARATQPEIVAHYVRLQGDGASVPVLEEGVGLTAARIGTGEYRLTFRDPPGRFMGATCGLGAATPAALAGHTVVRGEFDAANRRLDLTVFNAADAAHDLATAEFLDVIVYFARTSV